MRSNDIDGVNEILEGLGVREPPQPSVMESVAMLYFKAADQLPSSMSIESLPLPWLTLQFVAIEVSLKAIVRSEEGEATPPSVRSRRVVGGHDLLKIVRRVTPSRRRMLKSRYETMFPGFSLVRDLTEVQLSYQASRYTYEAVGLRWMRRLTRSDEGHSPNVVEAARRLGVCLRLDG